MDDCPTCRHQHQPRERAVPCRLCSVAYTTDHHAICRDCQDPALLMALLAVLAGWRIPPDSADPHVVTLALECGERRLRAARELVEASRG